MSRTSLPRRIGPDDYRPIKHMRLVQFDGRTWQPIGDVIETAFSDGQKK